MQMFICAAVVTIFTALGAPASAALIQYDFSAGGEGASSSAGVSDSSWQSPSIVDLNNFSMNARFIIDTSKMLQASRQDSTPIFLPSTTILKAANPS